VALAVKGFPYILNEILPKISYPSLWHNSDSTIVGYHSVMTIWQPDISFIFEADQGSVDDPFFRVVLEAFALNLRELSAASLTTEVIVATDQGLSTRETDFIRDFFDSGAPTNTLRFHVSSRSGYWAKKSLASHMAFGRAIVFLDADCVAQPGWALELVRALDAGADIVRPKTFGYYQNQHQTLMTAIWQFPTHFASDPIAGMKHSWGNNFAVKADFLRANPIGSLLPHRPDSRIAGHHWDSVDRPVTPNKVFVDAYVRHVAYKDLSDYLPRMRLHGREMQQVSVLAGAGVRTLLRKTRSSFAEGHLERLNAVADELGISAHEKAHYERIIRRARWAMFRGKLEAVVLDRNVRYVASTEAERSIELLGVANSLAIQQVALRELRIRGRVDLVKVVPKAKGLGSIATATKLNSKVVKHGAKADKRTVSSLGVSVIVPTRNRLAELCRALNSLSAQSVLPNEVVIINDGNPFDDFATELVRASLDPRINLKLVTGGGNGAAAARQLGCETSTQPVIAYLDDDNIMMVDWVETITKEFARPDVQAIYGAQIRTEFALGILGREFNVDNLKHANYIDTGTIAHRRTVGRWDPSVKKLNDWDFNLNMVLVEKVEYRYVPVLASLYFTDAPSRISDNGVDYHELAGGIRAKYGI
jgi:GT2 family glycosyltransferase